MADHRNRLVGMHARGADGQARPDPVRNCRRSRNSRLAAAGSTAGRRLFRLHATLRRRAGGERSTGAEADGTANDENAIGRRTVQPLKTAVSAYSNDTEFFPGILKSRIGARLTISTEPVLGGRSTGSLAWAELVNSHFWIDLAKGVAWVLLTDAAFAVRRREVARRFCRFETAVYTAFA